MYRKSSLSVQDQEQSTPKNKLVGTDHNTNVDHCTIQNHLFLTLQLNENKQYPTYCRARSLMEKQRHATAEDPSHVLRFYEGLAIAIAWHGATYGTPGDGNRLSTTHALLAIRPWPIGPLLGPGPVGNGVTSKATLKWK